MDQIAPKPDKPIKKKKKWRGRRPYAGRLTREPWETGKPDEAPAALSPQFVAQQAKEEAKKRPKRKQADHTPNESSRRMIANMSGYGLTRAQISKISGIDARSLYRYYGNELKTAALQKDLAMLQSAFLQGVGGPEMNWEKARPHMTKWWLEVRRGMIAPQKIEMDQRIQRIDLTALSDRELEALERIMAKAEAKQIEGRIVEEDGADGYRRSANRRYPGDDSGADASGDPGGDGEEEDGWAKEGQG